MRSTLDFERGPRLSVSSINNCISGSIHSFTVPTSVSSSSYKHTPLDLKVPLLSVQRASSVGFFYNTFRLKRSANNIDSNGLTEKDLQPLPGYMYIIYFFYCNIWCQIYFLLYKVIMMFIISIKNTTLGISSAFLSLRSLFSFLKGANVNAAKLHETALHHAAKAKNTDLIELLVEFGGNVYATDNLNKKPIHYTTLGSPSYLCLEFFESEYPPRVHPVYFSPSRTLVTHNLRWLFLS